MDLWKANMIIKISNEAMLNKMVAVLEKVVVKRVLVSKAKKM